MQKGHGYHLDLFVLALLMAACSLFGLPWFVAATVRAVTHVRSLVVESEVKAPGDKPQMLGVRLPIDLLIYLQELDQRFARSAAVVLSVRTLYLHCSHLAVVDRIAFASDFIEVISSL